MIKKVKSTVSWTYGINDLNGKKMLELFTKMNFKNKSKNVELKKELREKMKNYMLHGKATLVHIING